MAYIKIILASASPRRRELLENVGIHVKVRPTDADESVSAALSPQEYVKAAAMKKLQSAIPSAGPNELIIAADTMVFLDNQRLGKPQGEFEAYEMLSKLSGKHHTVCTGFALYLNGRTACDCESTLVYFKQLSDTDIVNYILTHEPLDKAGAYGIQGVGSYFVEKIEGDYFNVVGLPISKLFSVAYDAFGVKFFDLISYD